MEDSKIVNFLHPSSAFNKYYGPEFGCPVVHSCNDSFDFRRNHVISLILKFSEKKHE